MHIKKIKIDKFKSFYEPFELDFSNIKGLWKISGSVGSGKTTIGEAILFGLFGIISGKNNSDLVSWGHKTASLEIWCRSNSRDIYIKRNIANSGWSSIYVEIDGEELIFTNKRDAQKQLEEEYFDVSRVTMELLCIISFNNFKSLATLNTGETKKFLDQVLGFYILTRYSDMVKQLKQDNNKKLNLINNSISNINAQIRKLEEISSMEIVEGSINECNDEICAIDNKILEMKQQHGDICKRLNDIISDLKIEHTKIKTLGTAKSKEIQLIEKGICPTCGAVIDQSQLDIKRAEREALLKQYSMIEEKINNTTTDLTNATIEHNHNMQPLIERKNSLRELMITLKAQASRVNVNKSQIDKLLSELDIYKAEQEQCMTDGISWDRLYSIISNDVRAMILEKFIPALNSNIMKYATELHQPYIISFDSQFKCSVTLAGYNNEIPISSLSTGQLKIIDMIIILGVLGTVIGSASANVIFLDELFSNLDGALRNDMCSVLHKFISNDDTMFVISHQDLDDKYFNGTMKLHIDHKGQYEKHSKVSFTYN